LKYRWELGHAAGFAVQLVGLGALVISVLKETPKDSLKDHQAGP
jgi:hypothetical protein